MVISKLYGRFFNAITKQYLIIFNIEDFVFVSIGNIYGVTNKKISKEKNINGNAKYDSDKPHFSQKIKLNPNTIDIINMNSHIIVDFLKFSLNALKKVFIKDSSSLLRIFKFIEYKAVVAAPIVTIGRLQNIHRIFKINKSALLFINLENPLSVLNIFPIKPLLISIYI